MRRSRESRETEGRTEEERKSIDGDGVAGVKGDRGIAGRKRKRGREKGANDGRRERSKPDSDGGKKEREQSLAASPAVGEANSWRPRWRGGGWEEREREEDGLRRTGMTEGEDWYFFCATGSER